MKTAKRKKTPQCERRRTESGADRSSSCRLHPFASSTTIYFLSLRSSSMTSMSSMMLGCFFSAFIIATSRLRFSGPPRICARAIA